MGCSSLRGVDYTRHGVAILEKIKDILQLDQKSRIEIISVQDSLDVKELEYPFVSHHKMDLCDFLKETKEKFDLIILVGCNKVNWLFHTEDDIQLFYDSLAPNGKVVVYEGGLKSSGLTGFSRFEDLQQYRLKLNPNFPVKDENEILDVFNKYFSYSGDGMYIPIPTARMGYAKSAPKKVLMIPTSRKKSSDLISFYQGEIPANANPSYYFSDIIKWTDLQLEKKHDFIQWLFPSTEGGKNSKAPLLTEQDVKIFKKNKEIRSKVIKATLRMMKFYGYTITPSDQGWQVRKSGRNKYLYSGHNYLRLTRMMIFLNTINMRLLSALLFLMICEAMKEDKKLADKISKSGAMVHWKKTQEYVNPRTCPYTGLKYTGNSCYQDSVLLALLARPNTFITENLLEKEISYDPHRSIVCHKSRRKDLEYRKAVQNELVAITESIRGKKDIDYCSNLRSLLKKCPTFQEFHKTGTQDAGEFVSYLFELFKVEGVTVSRKSVVTNDLSPSPKIFLKVSQEIIHASPIIAVSPFMIKDQDTVILSSFLDQTDDTVFDEENLYRKNGRTYKRRIENMMVTKADFLIFNVQRTYISREGRTVRIYTEIVPDKKLTVQHKLTLYAIIVHRNVHYTCYIRCTGKWYYYNDMENSIKYVGDYNTMISGAPSPLKEGTMYFYE